jgi:mycothiol synthase
MDIQPLLSLKDGELLSLAHATGAGAVGVSAQTVADLAALRQAAVGWVAREGGRPAALVAAGPAGEAGVWSLRWLGVLPRVRRHGIGGALLAEVMKHAKAAGAAELRSGVLDSRNAAAAFAAKHGFAPRGIISLRMHRRDLENLPAIALPPGYALRPYRPGDEAAWIDLFRRIFADDLRSELPPTNPPSVRSEFLHSAYWRPERMWFADGPDGSPVGTTTAWVFPQDGRLVPILHWVGVLEAHRGQRLGEALSLACMNQPKQDGWNECWLTTQTFRAPAVKTYERLGFRIVYWRSDYARTL